MVETNVEAKAISIKAKGLAVDGWKPAATPTRPAPEARQALALLRGGHFDSRWRCVARELTWGDKPTLLETDPLPGELPLRLGADAFQFDEK